MLSVQKTKQNNNKKKPQENNTEERLNNYKTMFLYNFFFTYFFSTHTHCILFLQEINRLTPSIVFFNNLFIYFWLCWVFVAAHGLSLVEVSRGYSSLRCTGS